MSRKKTLSPFSLAETLEEEQTEPAVQLPDTNDLLTRYGLEVHLYAEKVVKGQILACKWVRLACERHQNDLKRSAESSFPFRFDPQSAGRIIYWLQLMPLVEGKFASPTLVLELWQKFIYGSVYGWLKKSDGLRRFTKVYLFVPRKNGKTTPLAGVGFFGMACDGELGAQIYNGANKRSQAEFLYKPAKRMLAKSSDILKRLGIVKHGESRMEMESTGAVWLPVTSSPGDGGGAHYWLQDEYHEAKSSKLRDTMVEGQIGRTQPIAWFISTFGHNLSGPCYSDWLEIQKLLLGLVELDHVFAIAYTIDSEPHTDPFGCKQPADDWTTVEAARKANPNWGISVQIDQYLAELKEAISDPSKQAAFKTKHLNIWCNAADGFFNLEQWKACADPTLTIEQFAHLPSLIGIDGASRIDLFSTAQLFRVPDPLNPDDEELAHYYVFWRNYQNEGQVNRRDTPHWAQWAAKNALIQTQGDVTDYRVIYRDLKQSIAAGDVREVCFDNRETAMLVQELADETGVTLFEVPQVTQVLSEPLKWLQALIVSRRIHHVGCPLVTWTFSNVVAKPDHNDNIFPRHSGNKHELKIDPVSALLDTLVRARKVLNQPPPADFVCEVWS